MRRRRFLTAATVASTALAGCTGLFGGSPDSGADGSPAEDDGYPPERDDQPEPIGADTESFERIEVEGQQVPLAPIEVTYNWYARQEARFADARGAGQYENSHITGAAWSPAPDGRDGSDPIEAWPTDDRIVCYCGCPHHLSSLRAAALIDAGYENVFVIDEGFIEWRDRGYPLAGADVETETSKAVIRGQSDATYAGDPVYATHEPTDQREAAFVGDDGGYELTLHFADLTDDSEIRIDAPDYTVVAPLSQLTGGVVTGS